MTRPPDPSLPPASAAAFGERLQTMRQTLDDACRLHPQVPLTPDEREQLKQAIITLFREADAALQQVQGWKDAVKALADQWKQLDDRPSTTVPAAPALNSGRVDHLGASTFLEKGWSKLSLLDAVGAEAAFRRALELAPGDTEAETLLSWALMQQERYDEAGMVAQVVLQRDPHHALARANVGYICLRQLRYGEAIEHLSTVIRADADRRAVLYAHLYLGMAYREREMYEDAEAFFRKSLELGPNLLQAWYELGRAYWFAGRRADARLAWKSGSEANKFSPWGKRCAELLDTVEQGAEPPRAG
jgi:tetratricopeptide (TPR) repeat protein